MSFTLLSFVWVVAYLDWFRIWMRKGVKFYKVNFEFEEMVGHPGEEVSFQSQY